MSEGHLQLQSFELVGYTRLGLGAHLLARPLLDPVEPPIDIHFRDWVAGQGGLAGRVRYLYALRSCVDCCGLWAGVGGLFMLGGGRSKGNQRLVNVHPAKPINPGGMRHQ
jgi:hypothetical protein